MTSRVRALLLCLSCSSLTIASEPIELSVWPGQAPDEQGDIGEEYTRPSPAKGKPARVFFNVTEPTITVHRPAKTKNNGAAVLICPGGGYNVLELDREGTEVAVWLNSLGVTGIVLKYRVPGREGRERYAAALQDAQRAMSLVRKHADAWEIDSARVGVMGFSAGGNLSALSATNHDRRRYEIVDEVDGISCRPDFAVLVYPGRLTEGEKLSAEVRVTKDTPPTFVVHATDDPRVSSKNSAVMYLALIEAKVPAELHIYASGGHGFGMRLSDHPASSWPHQCRKWMERRGLLERR